MIGSEITKYILSSLVLLTCQAIVADGKKCPSACTRDLVGCRSSGGKIIGYCVNGLACCDLTYKQIGTCGDTKTGVDAINFVSPDYPKPHGGDLICPFGLVLMEDTVAVKIEFLNITMDGLGFAGNGAGCDSDMFIFKGFKTWTPPPLCGNLTGYTTMVERTRTGAAPINQLKIVALMSSLNYGWKIRLTQIRQSKLLKASTSIPTSMPFKENAPKRPAFFSAQDRNSKEPRVNRQATMRKINHYATEQQIEKPYYANTDAGSKALNADAENIFVETGDIFEDNVDELEIPMIVNGDDTKIEQVPYQVSIRIVSSAKDSNDTDYDEETETTSTESSNDIFGVTIDYDSVTEAEGNLTNHTTPKPEVVDARNCSRDEGYHFCGGTIIADRFILTASHCFYGNSKLNGMEPLDKIKIVLGDTDTCTRDLNDTTAANRTDISPSDLTQQEHEIETVVFHYGYDNVALINDVAVIKLKTPIEFNSHVGRVRLARPGEEFQGKEAVGSGWGRKNLTHTAGGLPHILQSSPHFLIRNQTECNHDSERLFGANMTNVMHHPKYFHAFESVICTSTKSEVRTKLKGNVLVGPGDSGGPLVAQAEDGGKVLIGIVSYGIPSEHAEDKGDFVDFFQSVSFYHDWIRLAMMA